MKEMIRILIVEDLSTDAELAKREVAQVLAGSDFLCVDTREGLLKALDAYRPDIILSDYKLPMFDGMTALKLAIERAPEIPFIIITGSMNEETAVECLKAGAWDYVLKEHIGRLGPAVISGLAQKRLRQERKRAEEALKQRNAELERFNAVTVDREMRMIALKNEVNALLKAAGQPEKYLIVTEMD